MRVVSFVFLALLANESAGFPGLRDGFSNIGCHSTICEEISKISDGIEYVVDGHKIIVDYLEKKLLRLWCNPDYSNKSIPADHPALPAMLRPVTVEKAIFQSCLLPNSTYYEALKAFNVTVSKSLMLKLPPNSTLERHHLVGLEITDLEISADDDTKKPLASFDYLSEMRLVTLKLTNVIPEPQALMHLPTTLENIFFVQVNLSGAEYALRNSSDVPLVPLSWLERLPSLRFLHLAESRAIAAKYPKIVVLPRLNSFLNLTTVSLYHIPLNTDGLSECFIGSAVKTLVLNSCGLTELPEEMFENTKVSSINLTYNKITSLPLFLFAPLQNTLLELDLSNNNLEEKQLQQSLASMMKLETLKVNKNPNLGSLCGGESYIQPTNSRTNLPKTLQRLELSGTKATRICSDWVFDDTRLMHIDLSNNDITFISYGDLEMRRNPNETAPVEINLKNNPVIYFAMSRIDVNKCIEDASRVSDDLGILKRAQVKLQLSNLICDCDTYWLYRALKKCPLLQIKDDVPCDRKTSPIHKTILAYKPEEFLCPYNEDCIPGSDCSCWKRPHDNATVVQCASILPQQPKWPPAAPGWPLALHAPPGSLTAVPPVTLVELHAPNNNITRIDNLPSTLRILDVRNNSISHISLAAAEVLGREDTAAGKNYSVYLAGNRLACECNDAPAFGLLKRVVRDWNTTICADNINVSLKTKNELCANRLLPILFGAIVPILLLIVAAMVLRQLLPQIKQLLFKHNLCHSWILSVNDKYDDPDKTHDVFLSYSYADVERMKVLKNGLERLGYSTLEHSSDWLPGDAVMQQITNSVQCARRTLLLVSDDYAKSKWALEEFQAAHRHAMERGTARVVLVRCHLQKAEVLPPDLKIYHDTHTYLDWKDSKFWYKLCLLMPRLGHEHRSVLIEARHMEPPNCKLEDKSLPLLQHFEMDPMLSIYPPSATVPGAC